jgi:hypothetical protein
VPVLVHAGHGGRLNGLANAGRSSGWGDIELELVDDVGITRELGGEGVQLLVSLEAQPPGHNVDRELHEPTVAGEGAFKYASRPWLTCTPSWIDTIRSLGTGAWKWVRERIVRRIPGPVTHDRE